MSYVHVEYIIDKDEEFDWAYWDVDYVRYSGDGGWPYDREYAEKHGVTRGKTYKVELTSVDRFSSEFFLEEFPGLGFNTVMFERIPQKMSYSMENELKDFSSLELANEIILATKHVDKILKLSGVITAGNALRFMTGGSTWHYMAVIDLLIEVGYLKEIASKDCAWQDRVLTYA